MKSLIIFFCAFAPTLLLFSQHQVDAELKDKLAGVENFQKIKNTVLEHYQNKSSLARTQNDSVELKKYNKQLKFWNRHFWMQENYVDGNGKPVSRSSVDYPAIQRQTKKFAQQTNIRAQQSPWILEGPTFVTNQDGIGRIDDIAFHPTNPNIMFAGSPHGGLFKTTDAGSSWFPIADFLSSVGVAGIAIHPTNPDIIYVLSGNSNNSEFSLVNAYLYGLPSLGVFKTTDGGINWALQKMPTTAEYIGRDIKMDPTNPEVLIVSTNGKIFRTDNGGDTWDIIFNNALIDFYNIEFKPDDSDVVYIARDFGIARSNNNGLGFNLIPMSSIDSSGRTAIAVHPSNPNALYLVAGNFDPNSNGYQGVFISNDAGYNFTTLSTSPNLMYSFNSSGPDVKNNQSSYNMAIAVNPLNPSHIYVGGLSCWRSTNGGITWTQISNYWNSAFNYMHPDIHALEFNPINNNLYCGNDGGVYNLANSGFWHALHTGLSAATFYHFEFANDEGDLWGGCQDNGIIERDAGGTFEEYFGGDGYDMMTDHNALVDNGEANDIYFTVNDKVFKDAFGGILEITPSGNTSFFGNLAMSPVDEDKIYLGYPLGFYKSENAGDDWQLQDTKPANWAIATCRSNDNVIYHSGSNQNVSGIYRFNNGTGTSSDRTGGMNLVGYQNGLKITDIDVSLTNHNIVYVSVAGTVSTSKVFKSTNGGITWENLSFDLPNVPIFCIKSNATGGIYVGTSIGVYFKRDGVTHWEYFGNDLPPVPVTEIEFDPVVNLSKIYCSTFGRGIWSTSVHNGICFPIKNLSGAIEGIQYQEASDQINSTQIISANPGTTMKYNTSGRIFLTPGFMAKQGTFFKTYNTGCGGAHGDN